MSIHEEKLVINPYKIQNFVKNEILAEQKYQRENDAKFRAIEQRVPTYEDFRQMVLASHLKPLDKGESLKNNIVSRNNNAWNSAASKSGTNNLANESEANSKELEKDSLVKTVPKSSLEFMKTWRLIEQNYKNNQTECNQIKWCFMSNLNSEKLNQIFQAEINGELLGNFLVLFDFIISSLDSNTSREFVSQIADMLRVFTKCNRFSLNLMFLKSSEVDACKRVLKSLSECQIDTQELEKLYVK
jgi:hypothetical protein